MELIKANQGVLLSNFLGDLDDALVVACQVGMEASHRSLLLHVSLVDPLVDVLHELMEVNAILLSFHWNTIVEQIHQHALACAHIAIQINTARNTNPVVLVATGEGQKLLSRILLFGLLGFFRFLNHLTKDGR